MPSAAAGVYLGERRVGTIGYADGNTWFDYEDRELAHPVLGQAFEADPGRRRTASGTVPEWFANLLPESGSGLRSLVARELGRSNPHDFQVLTFLGGDLPGAVRVVPDPGPGDIPELAEMSTDGDNQRVRFSLAGIQVKFSMRWEGKGLVLPMTGRGGDWIVKLPDRRFPDVPINEFAMLTWARAARIEVPEIRLMAGGDLSGLPDGLVSADELVIAVRRFDRTATGRVHQEDIAQVREVSMDRKYDHATYSGLARLLDALCPEDIPEYVRRLAAMVVMGNLDAHLKNWSLCYPDGRTARLSPAYDLISVSAYPAFGRDELAFALDGGRIARNISMLHFRRFAERAGLDVGMVLSEAARTVRELVDGWPGVRNDHLIPAHLVGHIDERLRTLPLVVEALKVR